MFVNKHSKTSADTGRDPSGRIWGKLPLTEWAVGNGGFFFHDDFLNFPKLSTSADTGKYASYADTSDTITQLATVIGGAARLSIAATDNNESWITTGGNTGVMCTIDDAAPQIVAFECRFQKSSIADNALAFFVGLGEEALAAANTLIDDTGEIASKDMIGFRCMHDNGEELDFVYRIAGSAVQEKIANIQALVADTYIKLGFLYDPFTHPNSKKIKIFVDGLEQTTYVTQANIEAALFPAGEELALLFGAKVGAATARTAQLDWWRIAGSLP